MRLRRRSWQWAAVAVGIAIATVSLSTELVRSGSSARRAEVQAGAGVAPGGSAVRTAASSDATTCDGTAPCCPDPLTTPAATGPTSANPNAGYGVPFVAQITLGVLRTGYHADWVTKVNPHINDPLYVAPWSIVVDHITGWVTGLLSLPDLVATIAPSQIAFCDQIQTPLPHADQLVRFTQFVDGGFSSRNWEDGTSRVLYLPWVLELAATAPATLRVAGVETDGAMDLSGVTPAQTTVDVYFSCAANPSIPQCQADHHLAYGLDQTCSQVPGTAIGLSTEPQSSVGSYLPGVLPTYGLSPLTGRLPGTSGTGATESATLGGDNFAINEFVTAPVTPPTGCQTGNILNPGLAGWTVDNIPGTNPPTNAIWQPPTSPTAQGINLLNKTLPASVATLPGYAQFSAKTTITCISLPIGMPSGFGFTPSGIATPTCQS